MDCKLSGLSIAIAFNTWRKEQWILGPVSLGLEKNLSLDIPCPLCYTYPILMRGGRNDAVVAKRLDSAFSWFRYGHPRD